MSNIIQLRRAVTDVVDAAAEPVAAAPAPRPPASIATVMDALSRTLDNIRTLCASLPEGSARAELEAKQVKLTADLSAVRKAVARIAAAQAAAGASERAVTKALTGHR